LVAEIRDSLELFVIVIEKRLHPRVGTDVIVHVLHVSISDTHDPSASVLQFRRRLGDLVKKNTVIMFLNRKHDGEDGD
jgi:hypothetical protein